ncbi:hypothetical protein [Kribbella sp. NPDC055071]
MRMRSVVGLIGVAAVLAGCSGPGQENAPNVPPLVSVSSQTPSDIPTPTPSATPSETPSGSKVADTLCVRMDPTLVQSTLAVATVQIEPAQLPADFGLPTYDVCQLALSTKAGGPVLKVETSVLPATKSTLTSTLKAYTATKAEPAKPALVGEAGYGTSTFVVFLLQGRLYRVIGPQATLAKYVVLGQDVAKQAPGLPDPRPDILQSDCERGSSLAEKVMGAPATARRDGESRPGDLVCGWVTADSVLSTSVRRTRKAEALMAPIRAAKTSQPIPLGDEGYVDIATGRTTIRVGDDKLIELVPLPARAVDVDLMTSFALAMAPLYTR